MSRKTCRFQPDDEIGRKSAVDRLNVLDTEPEPEFEKINDLIRTCLDVPIATVSLIDSDRQWFKSISGLDATEAPREITFCTHAIKSPTCTVIPDATKDPTFENNPFVTEDPFIRAYLGAPLITPDGYAVGTVCAIDVVPRNFTPQHETMMIAFADVVMNELELRTLASNDHLTNLATRRTFVEALQTINDSETPSALIFIDLDHFKEVNDTFGHPAGDAVLKHVGKVLIDHCPGTGVAGRMGGEELAMLLPGIDLSSAILRAEKLRAAIADMRFSDHPELRCTASLGVAMRKGHSNIDAWMGAADQALYWAKDNGRDRVVEAADEKAA